MEVMCQLDIWVKYGNQEEKFVAVVVGGMAQAFSLTLTESVSHTPIKETLVKKAWPACIGHGAVHVYLGHANVRGKGHASIFLQNEKVVNPSTHKQKIFVSEKLEGNYEWPIKCS